jgi:RNA recognition motif-containing protein
VGNLSYDLTDKDVTEFFGQVGPVKTVRCATSHGTSPTQRQRLGRRAGARHAAHGAACCRRIVTERETGKPRGFGFVEFFDIATADSAIRNLSGLELSGRTIRCTFAEGGPGDFRPSRREGKQLRGPAATVRTTQLRASPPSLLTGPPPPCLRTDPPTPPGPLPGPPACR